MSNGTGIAWPRTAARGGIKAYAERVAAAGAGTPGIGGSAAANGRRIDGVPLASGLRLDGASSGVGMRIGGHASLFGVVDLGRDAVEPGAFAAALARRGAAGIRMLFQHDPAEPVGRWTAMREDRDGLWVEGRLTAGVQKADELAALISSGALDGLSIGFRTVRAQNDRKNGVRRIVEADLWEVSIVTFPMLPGARLAVLPDGKSAEFASPDGPLPAGRRPAFGRPVARLPGGPLPGRAAHEASPAPRGDGGRLAALRLAAGLRSATRTLHGKEERA